MRSGLRWARRRATPRSRRGWACSSVAVRQMAPAQRPMAPLLRPAQLPWAWAQGSAGRGRKSTPPGGGSPPTRPTAVCGSGGEGWRLQVARWQVARWQVARWQVARWQPCRAYSGRGPPSGRTRPGAPRRPRPAASARRSAGPVRVTRPAPRPGQDKDRCWFPMAHTTKQYPATAFAQAARRFRGHGSSRITTDREQEIIRVHPCVSVSGNLAAAAFGRPRRPSVSQRSNVWKMTCRSSQTVQLRT